MGLNLSEWKDLLPFGTALFGAMIGGIINYKMSKIAQKREMRKKRLEAIFELEGLVIEVIKKSEDMKNQIIKCDETTENVIEAKKELNAYGSTYAKDLIDFQTKGRSLAIFISREIYKKVTSTFDTISNRYMSIVNLRKKNENSNFYSTYNIDDMEIILQELLDLNNDIVNSSKLYSGAYIDEYVENYKE